MGVSPGVMSVTDKANAFLKFTYILSFRTTFFVTFSTLSKILQKETLPKKSKYIVLCLHRIFWRNSFGYLKMILFSMSVIKSGK